MISMAAQLVLLPFRRLTSQLARTMAQRDDWENQSWELSDAVLRASDVQADMARTLEETRARHAAELAAAEERARACEEVRITLPAVAEY